MLEKLLAEIEELKQAKVLLEKVFIEICPYGQNQVPDELRWKINDFFKFDDSE